MESSNTCTNGDIPMTPSCILGYAYKTDAEGCCPNENRPPPNDVCPKGSLYYDEVTLQTQQCSGGAVDSCPGKSVCNPMTGFCCSKLLLCSGKNQRPEITELKKPNPCSAGCGTGFRCQDTGFCCRHKDGHYGEPCVDNGCFDGTECRAGKCDCPAGHFRDNDACKLLPGLGETCNEDLGCSGLLVICLGTCQCMTDFGYAPALNEKDCARERKRLDEACQSHAECKTAYSYCTKKKRCACLPGFTKDLRTGACISNTAFVCGDGNPPILKDGVIQECDKYPKYYKDAVSRDTGKRQRDPVGWPKMISFDVISEDEMTDTCDGDAYCNTYYDEPKPNYYKGFCCKKPPGRMPRCPIGAAHDSSKSPNFGCEECPMTTHYCHSDPYASGQTICCAKPCKNPSDVYDKASGQCYEPAAMNELCEVDQQCMGSGMPRSFSVRLHSRTERPLNCLVRPDGMNTCGCKLGYIAKNGKCIRAKCTVGIKGEPLSSYDKVTTMQCLDNEGGMPLENAENYDVCPFGFLCDPEFNVCCHDVMGPPDPPAADCPFFAPYATGDRCPRGEHFECNQNGGVIRIFCFNNFCCSRDP